MQSPTCFIVKPVNGKRYDNTRKMGDIDFIVSTSEEDHRFSNRQAEVIEVPRKYDGPIKRGDTLLVHHNVFKFYNDIRGRQRSGRSFFKDDIFLVDPDQFFLYKQDGRWCSYDRYCFVRPGDNKQQPLIGTMVYPNEYLIRNGVKPGDAVCFRPDSEYEFDVDGEKLYRMFDHQITMTL